jgi:RNA polymerase sigma-70 factor (ECF subfamily)
LSTDEQLLLAYREKRDRQAFEVLVHRYERELYSYLRRYLADANLAEDAFQATFLQVHLKCHQFQSDKTFRPWVYAIATHQAIDVQRRGKRHRMLSLDKPSGGGAAAGETDSMATLLQESEPGPATQAETAEEREWVRRAVESLPESLRATVALVYYQGLKYREAAEILGIPVGTVKSRLHTALLKMQDIRTGALAEEAIGPRAGDLDGLAERQG